jgi:hypothetical protein
MDRSRWTKVAAAAVALIVVVAMSTPAFSQAAAAKGESIKDVGAVYSGNFPDPSILVANGRYYV